MTPSFFVPYGMGLITLLVLYDVSTADESRDPHRIEAGTVGSAPSPHDNTSAPQLPTSLLDTLRHSSSPWKHHLPYSSLENSARNGEGAWRTLTNSLLRRSGRTPASITLLCKRRHRLKLLHACRTFAMTPPTWSTFMIGELSPYEESHENIVF